MDDSDKGDLTGDNSGHSWKDPLMNLATLGEIIKPLDIPISLSTEEIIDPIFLGFIPTGAWLQKYVSIAYLKSTYFSRKNNIKRRFEHKLWNALQITKAFPKFVDQIGVIWVTNNVFKVYKNVFANLLNITAVNGGLFHKQGNFPRHGFLPLSEQEAKMENIPPNFMVDVDFHDILLLYHKERQFTMSSSEDSITTCKWVNPAPATRIAFLKEEGPNEINVKTENFISSVTQPIDHHMTLDSYSGDIDIADGSIINFQNESQMKTDPTSVFPNVNH